jgi:hypothetical protein
MPETQSEKVESDRLLDRVFFRRLVLAVAD